MKKHYKMYLSGPISSLPINEAKSNFKIWKQRFSKHYEEVINPFDLVNITDETCMKKDLAELKTCYGLLLLPGWENYTDANVELAQAEKDGQKIYNAVTHYEFLKKQLTSWEAAKNE